MIENVIEIDMYEQYFKSTFIIIQVQEELQIKKIASMEILQKFFEKKGNALQIKILLLGESAIGKTCLIERYVNNYK